VSITRLARCGALVALLLGTLVAGPAGAGASPAAQEVWVGQVQRHARHFDYVGQPCPADPATMCAMYVADYRIVPVTRQAARALPRMAGRTARLFGHLQPGRVAHHQGKLVVTRVEANNPPPPPPPPPGKSGVEGTVMAGPTCPVVRPDDPCADRPVETDLRLAPANGSTAITGHSGADGRFHIQAPAGHYTLTAQYSSGPSGCQPVDVDVKAGRLTHADVSCDTGIR
jgi:hypothetical protein